jgi:hypothetical protein
MSKLAHSNEKTMDEIEVKYRDAPDEPRTAYAFEPSPRSRKQHMADIRRECFKHKLAHLNDDAEKAVDFVRDLMRAEEDVTSEINQLDLMATELLLVIGVLRLQIERESNNGQSV